MQAHPLYQPGVDYFGVNAFNASGLKITSGISWNPEALEVGTQVDNFISYGTQPTNIKAITACRAFALNEIGKTILQARKDGTLQAQHEYYRVLPIGPDRHEVWVKAKLDLVLKGKYNIDIKTTSASSRSAFEAHIKSFDYYMSQGHYHRMARVDKSLLCVISTKNSEVYIRPMDADKLAEGAARFDQLLYSKLQNEGYL